MGQNRGIERLPAPRIFATPTERLTYDARVYDAIKDLASAIGITEASITAISEAPEATYEPEQLLFANSAGAIIQSEHLYFEGGLESDYPPLLSRLVAPRIFLTRTAGADAYPPLAFELDDAELTEGTGTATELTSIPPTADTVADEAFWGGLETDGNHLYFTDLDGSRRALAMFGTGLGSAVSGKGEATRVAFWNGANRLLSNASLYWDNSNARLGIGTASPSQYLHVFGTPATNMGVMIQNDTSAAASGDNRDADLWLYNRTRRWAVQSNGLTGNFQINDDDAGSVARFSISTSGAVSFSGAASFGATTITGTTNTFMQTITDGTREYGVYVGSNVAGGIAGAFFGTKSNHQAWWGVNSATYRMCMNTSGNVGLNVDSPTSFMFQIAGSIGPNADVSYDLGSTSAGWRDAFARHWYATQGTAPTPSLPTPAEWGTGTVSPSVTAAAASRDMRGQIDVNTGNHSGAGNTANPTVTVTYGNGYSTNASGRNVPVVQAVDATALRGVTCEIVSYSNTAFTFMVNAGAATLAASTTYSFVYHVIG